MGPSNSVPNRAKIESWGILGGRPWGGPRGLLGRPGGVLGPLGGVLGASRGRLGASWGVLGASWGVLGTSWERLGPLLGTFQDSLEKAPFLEPSWAPKGGGCDSDVKNLSEQEREARNLCDRSAASSLLFSSASLLLLLLLLLPYLSLP